MGCCLSSPPRRLARRLAWSAETIPQRLRAFIAREPRHALPCEPDANRRVANGSEGKYGASERCVAPFSAARHTLAEEHGTLGVANIPACTESRHPEGQDSGSLADDYAVLLPGISQSSGTGFVEEPVPVRRLTRMRSCKRPRTNRAARCSPQDVCGLPRIQRVAGRPRI